MSRKNKMILYPCLCLLLLFFLASCSSAPSDEESSEASYKIYYINTSQNSLLAVDYETETRDIDLLIEELIGEFLKIPKHVEGNPALEDRVLYKSYERDENILYVYFDNNYLSMKAGREILARAALVKTLSQVEGIDYVGIYSGDNRVMGETDLYSATDFADSISDINSFRKMELSLYFADKSGNKLVEERRELVFNMENSMERFIIDQLMAGTAREDLQNTIPDSTNLLSVYVSGNICYVNFDETFLSNSLGVKDYIRVYSIVNSLSEISDIQKVQIMINGSQDINLSEGFSLSNFYERNLDYLIE